MTSHDEKCKKMRERWAKGAPAVRQRKTQQTTQGDSFNPLEINITELIEKLYDKDFRDEFLPESIAWEIRTQVRLIRQHKGWTQEELARRSGLSYPTISRIENLAAADSITVGSLMKIAHAFDCALIVRFESWGQYIAWLRELQKVGIKYLIPPSFEEDEAMILAHGEQETGK